MPRLLTGVSGCALLGVIAISPWFLGGVESQVQVWIYLAVLAALVLCWAGIVGRVVTEFSLAPAFLVLVLALGLGLLQLVAWPRDVLGSLSPRAEERWAAVCAAPGDSQSHEVVHVAANDNAGTVSLYPASTRRTLHTVALATAAFLLGGLVFREAAWSIGLLVVFAVNGAVLAGFGLVQQLTWNGKLFWTIPLTQGGTPFATFVNRNNAAGFLNICLAAAVGWSVWALARRHRLLSPPGGHRGSRAVLAFVASLDGWALAALLAAGALVAGVLCSLSRGAAVAMVAAAMVTLLAAAGTKGVRGGGGWLIVAVIGATAIVGVIGKSADVRQRLSSVLNYSETSNSRRLDHWRDGWRAAGDYWTCGSGLGTYRYVYRPYERTVQDVWYYHAENQYLEALVEAGWPGLLLLLSAIGLTGLACWRLLETNAASPDFALGIAGTFALASQAVHAFFDFGLYLPANMLALATICGAVAGRAAWLSARNLPVSSWRAGWLKRATSLPCTPALSASLIAVLAGAIWLGFQDTRATAAFDAVSRRVRQLGRPGEVDAAALRDVVRDLDSVLERRADDAETLRLAADLRLQLWRAERVEQARADGRSDAEVQRLGNQSSPAQIHRTAHRLAATNRRVELHEFRAEPLTQRHLIPALSQLRRARRAAPVFAEVDLHLAELCGLDAEPAGDRMYLESARQLAAGSPSSLLYIGLLELQAGRPDMAAVTWRKCLDISPASVGPVVALAASHPDLAKHLDDLLPDSPEVLLRAAREQFGRPEQADIRRTLVRKAERLAAANGYSPEERYFLTGSMLALRDQPAKAISYLTKAVELRPEEVAWRYELALLLHQRGLVEEAREQAGLCVRLQPGNPQYEELLRQLIRARLQRGRDASAETASR